MMIQRGLAGVTLVAAVAGLMAYQVAPGKADNDDDEMVILAWERMAAEPPGAVRVDTNTRGIVGGKLPWDINSAGGRLTVDGELEIRIRGLVLDHTLPNDGTPFSGGLNPFKTFSVIVSCLTPDPETGELVVVNVAPLDQATGNPRQFRASVPGGDCDIHTHVALPDPCMAPIVFVTSPLQPGDAAIPTTPPTPAGTQLTWIAVTGFGN